MQRETTAVCTAVQHEHISILSLYAEGDTCRKYEYLPLFTFQSSPSMQRETYYIGNEGISLLEFQSSPSMQRETAMFYTSLLFHVISILSLYADGDSAL